MSSMADRSATVRPTSKTPGMGLPARTRSLGAGRNGGDIVSQQDPSMSSCPLQHARVICAGKADVLNPDQIDTGLSKTNPSNDVVVEVLVRE